MNREQARAFLGDGEPLPDRTFARLVNDEDGKLGWRVRQTKSGKNRIYDNEDLTRLKDHLIGERAVKSARPISAEDSDGKLARQTNTAKGKGITPDAMMLAFGNLAAALAGRQTANNEIAITVKLTLTIKEAAELSGLPASYIRQQLASGKLAGLKTGAGWRIGRRALDAFVERVVGQGSGVAHFSEHEA